MTKTYFSKILLFGEYTVIDGSAAIAVPYKNYSGRWAYDGNLEDQEGLHKLKKYLSHLYYKKEIEGVDFDQFERDLTRGLIFDSTVPTGYGLGSSGTLTAAFYDKYVLKNEQIDLKDLKKHLAQIESCFHGDSSGIDPLVSYLNLPLLAHPDGDIEILDIDRSSYWSDLILIDTGISRETARLVEAYKHTRSVHEGFAKATLEIAELTDMAITSYILNEKEEYVTNFKALSEKQAEVLHFLVPPHFLDLWKEGLESNAFYMKLCGAGGGGCILAHVNDKAATEEILEDEKYSYLNT